MLITTATAMAITTPTWCTATSVRLTTVCLGETATGVWIRTVTVQATHRMRGPSLNGTSVTVQTFGRLTPRNGPTPTVMDLVTIGQRMPQTQTTSPTEQPPPTTRTAIPTLTIGRPSTTGPTLKASNWMHALSSGATPRSLLQDALIRTAMGSLTSIPMTSMKLQDCAKTRPGMPSRSSKHNGRTPTVTALATIRWVNKETSVPLKRVWPMEPTAWGAV